MTSNNKNNDLIGQNDEAILVRGEKQWILMASLFDVKLKKSFLSSSIYYIIGRELLVCNVFASLAVTLFDVIVLSLVFGKWVKKDVIS